MHGHYETIDERPVLRFERRLAHPVDAVWRAVTEPEELAQWFPSSVEGALEPQSELKFSFPNDIAPPMDGRVLAVDPPHRFEFTLGRGRAPLRARGGRRRRELRAASDGPAR